MKENKISKNLIQILESKYQKENSLVDNENQMIEIGDILRIGYLIPEGGKDRLQFYQGLVLSIQNRGLGKSFTLRRKVQGIGVEQIFVAHSPKISFLKKKRASKVRRAKLYFLRFLQGKSTRLKRKE